MQNKKILIYGAYGYTGELMVHEAVRRGLNLVIAGRTQAKLDLLATQLGLESRTFSITSIDNHLSDIAVVLNCAGPFTSTAPAFVEACLKNQVHYVDITGEIPVFQYCHEQDAQAKAAGVVLCPGAGFDVVPTDCLASSLKERLPDATRIDLGFNFGTRPSIGTIKTAIEGAASGGLIRENHRIISVPQGYRIRRITFPNGKRWGVSFPWGDVYTSHVSTGVPDSIVYAAMPLLLCVSMRLMSFMKFFFTKPAVTKVLQQAAENFFSGGPEQHALDTQRTEFWGEATNAKGERVSGQISGPNVYTLTVDTAIEIALHCLTQPVTAGYQTPSMLMGNNFFSSRPQVLSTYF